MTPAAQVSWKSLNIVEQMVRDLHILKEKTLILLLVVCLLYLWVGLHTFACEATNYKQFIEGTYARPE